MKKLILSTLIAVCIACVLFSCKKNLENSVPEFQNSYSKVLSGDSIIHKLNINGSIETIIEVNGAYYIYGDIAVPAERFKLLVQLAQNNVTTKNRSLLNTSDNGTTGGPWSNDTAYYEEPVVGESLDGVPALTAAEHVVFLDTLKKAITEISDSVGIVFKLRTNQTAYLKFIKSNKNSAALGYWKDYRNYVRLEGYNRRNTVMHEILHALGVSHEHQRADRDTYLIVDTSKILPNLRSNFNIKLNSSLVTSFGDFDFKSIMLYSPNLQINIDNDDAGFKARHGYVLLNSDQKPGLSSSDARGLRSIYPNAVTGIYKMKSFDQNKYLRNWSNSYLWLNVLSDVDGFKFKFTKNNDGTYLIQPNSNLTKALYYDAATSQVKLGNLTVNSLAQKFILHFEGDFSNSIAPASDDDKRLSLETFGIDVSNRGATTSAAQKVTLIR